MMSAKYKNSYDKKIMGMYTLGCTVVKFWGVKNVIEIKVSCNSGFTREVFERPLLSLLLQSGDLFWCFSRSLLGLEFEHLSHVVESRHDFQSIQFSFVVCVV